MSQDFTRVYFLVHPKSLLQTYPSVMPVRTELSGCCFCIAQALRSRSSDFSFFISFSSCSILWRLASALANLSEQR